MAPIKPELERSALDYNNRRVRLQMKIVELNYKVQMLNSDQQGEGIAAAEKLIEALTEMEDGANEMLKQLEDRMASDNQMMETD